MSDLAEQVVALEQAVREMRRQRDEAQTEADVILRACERAIAERDGAVRDGVRVREAVQAAVPRILGNIHHESGCLYFTPKRVCNCGTQPAYRALTELADAARTADAGTQP